VGESPFNTRWCRGTALGAHPMSRLGVALRSARSQPRQGPRLADRPATRFPVKTEALIGLVCDGERRSPNPSANQTRQGTGAPARPKMSEAASKLSVSRGLYEKDSRFSD
jgi:hypothetical protein